MNYNHLRYFWAVAHEGNLTRAARKLRVSQSAVSTQIRKLEGELGQSLFERRGRGILLTEAGRVALDHADAIFTIGDELVGTLHETGARAPVLRVGALATLSRNFQLGFIEPLLDEADVELQMRSGPLGELLGLLEEHRLDVVLANTAPPRTGRSSWVSHAIAEQPVSLVGHPNPARRGRTLEELLRTEPLVLPGPQSSIRAGFDALVARLGVRPTVTAHVDDMAMLRLVARSHTGLSVVPPVVVRDELQGNVLVEVERLTGITETFVAITLERRFPNALVQMLLSPRAEWLEEAPP